MAKLWNTLEFFLYQVLTVCNFTAIIITFNFMFAKLSSNFSNQEHFTDNAKLANKKKVEWKPNITYGTMLKWNLAKKGKKRKEKSCLLFKDNFRNLLMRFAEAQAFQSLLKIEMNCGTFLAVFLNIVLGWIYST